MEFAPAVSVSIPVCGQPAAVQWGPERSSVSKSDEDPQMVVVAVLFESLDSTRSK